MEWRCFLRRPVLGVWAGVVVGFERFGLGFSFERMNWLDTYELNICIGPVNIWAHGT